MKSPQLKKLFSVLVLLQLSLSSIPAQIQIVRCTLAGRCGGSTSKEVKCVLNSGDPAACNSLENIILADGTILMRDELIISGLGTDLEMIDKVLLALDPSQAETETDAVWPENFLNKNGDPLLCEWIDAWNAVNIPNQDYCQGDFNLILPEGYCKNFELVLEECNYDMGDGSSEAEIALSVDGEKVKWDVETMSMRIPFWRPFGTTMSIAFVTDYDPPDYETEIKVTRFDFPFPANVTFCDGPDFVTEFIPDEIVPGETSILNYIATRPLGDEAWKAGMPFNITNTLPAEVIINTPLNYNSSCGGILNATPGGSMIELLGAYMPINTTSCSLTIEVKSDILGEHENYSILSSGLDKISDPSGSLPSLGEHVTANAIGPVQSDATLIVSNPIPSIGQWGLLILGLSIIILGTLGIYTIDEKISKPHRA